MNLLPISKAFHLNSRIKHKLRIKSSSSESILEPLDRTWTKDTPSNQHVSPFIIFATRPHVGNLCELTFRVNSQNAVTKSYPN